MDWVGSSAIEVLCLSFAAAGEWIVTIPGVLGLCTPLTRGLRLVRGGGWRVAGGGLLLSGGFVQYGLDAGGGGGPGGLIR